VLTFNLNRPSTQRAERQLAYLAGRPEHVLVLTETAPSAGCDLLADRFRSAGHHVLFPRPPEPGERGVMLVSRLALRPSPVRFGYLPHRAVAATVDTAAGPLEIVGLYVPSRDATPEKTARKRQFLAECRRAIPAGPAEGGRLVIGDFNVLEPDHRPRYGTFQAFEYDFYRWLGDAGYADAFRTLYPGAAEYSWVGRTGDGYRYDHAHLSAGLAGALTACRYLHEPRTAPDRLTDHSALSLHLAVAALAPLPVADPVTTEAAGVLF
jgi:exodeoxyribonuclease-3